MKIGTYTLTRDSLVLWLPVVGAVVAYLMASAPPSQWSYHDWLKAVSAAIAAGSTWLMTSGLPGKNDPPKGSIDLTKMAPMVLLALALGGAAVLPTGCAKGPAPVVTPSARTAKALSAVRRIGVVLEQVQLQELALFQAGEVPADVHAKIVVAFKDTSATVLVALDTLQASANGDARQVVQAVRDGLQQLAATFAHLNTKQAAQLAGWLDTAAALVEVSLS